MLGHFFVLFSIGNANVISQKILIYYINVKHIGEKIFAVGIDGMKKVVHNGCTSLKVV